MAAIARELDIAVDLPWGANVLRNDVEAALSVAAAAGGAFVRVNVHTTDTVGRNSVSHRDTLLAVFARVNG